MSGFGNQKENLRLHSAPEGAGNEENVDSRPLNPTRIRERIRNLQWSSILALLVSIAALITTAFSNYLVQTDRKVRESPFVIPTVTMQKGRYSIELGNYSAISAEVRAIRFISGGRDVVIDESNRRQVMDSRFPEFRNFLGEYFFERFGIDTGQSLGVNMDINIPVFMRIRQDIKLLEVSGLAAVAQRLPNDVNFETYTQRLMTDLDFEVCSCDIYGETCIIAGTLNAPRRLDACPAPSEPTRGSE